MTTKWTTIKIPKEIHEKIKQYRQRYGKATWRIILEALSFFETISRKPRSKEELPDLDKFSWYITKLATSFGAFKENPSHENLIYLEKRVKELREKLGIDASHLALLAERYMRAKNDEEKKKLRIELNMAFKSVIKELLQSYVPGKA